LFARVAPESDGFGRFGSELPAPAGFLELLDTLGKLMKPVYLTGVGARASGDRQSLAPASTHALLDHLSAVSRAVAVHPYLKGYFHYSLLDGWEWTEGYIRRHGLIHVDRSSLARTPNPSAFLLRDIIHAHAITPGIVGQHARDWREGQP
jgi:beta-glucosidase